MSHSSHAPQSPVPRRETAGAPSQSPPKNAAAASSQSPHRNPNTAPVTLREFARYALMNVLGMAGLSCYILADTFFVANGLGTEGLAALNLAIPAYNLLHGVGLMLGMGGATKYAVFRAQGKRRQADLAFTAALLGAFGAALLFILFALLGAAPVAAALGARGEVLVMTRTYLRTLLLFSPAFLANDVLLCFVRNDGRPEIAMRSMLAGSFSNIVLDYLFIFPLGMGIFGAVFATGLAPIISVLLLTGFLRSPQRGFALVLPERLHWQTADCQRSPRRGFCAVLQERLHRQTGNCQRSPRRGFSSVLPECLRWPIVDCLRSPRRGSCAAQSCRFEEKAARSHPSENAPRLSLSFFTGLLSLGFPSLVTELSSGVVMVVFNVLVMRLAGTVGVAAYGVVANLSLVVLAVCTGLAQGMQPLASRAHGGGDRFGVRRVFTYALTSALLLSLALYGLIFALAEPITAVFNAEHDLQLQGIAASGLRLYFLGAPFAAVNILLCMAFASTERPRPAQLLSLGRGFYAIVPLAFLFASLGGLTGVWLSFPVTEIVMLAAGVLCALYPTAKPTR